MKSLDKNNEIFIYSSDYRLSDYFRLKENPHLYDIF